MSENSSGKRTVIATVVSDKSDKTIVVSVKRRIRHPKYGKYIERTSKLHVHDPENTGRMGDLVAIASSRPISKKKTWTLVEILERAQ